MKEISIDGVRYKLTQIGENVVKNLNAVTFPAVEFHVNAKEMTWQEAMDYAEKLGDGWRLPTKEELQAYAPQLRELGCKNWFWSASTVSYDTYYAWYVNLALGYTYNLNKNIANSVVCVRP